MTYFCKDHKKKIWEIGSEICNFGLEKIGKWVVNFIKIE